MVCGARLYFGKDDHRNLDSAKALDTRAVRVQREGYFGHHNAP